MNPISWLIYAWRTPNSFRGDWRKYMNNQSGHGLAGIIAGVLTQEILDAAPWTGLAVFFSLLTFYTLWEKTQWDFRQAEASDCFEDWAFVYLGFVIGLTGNWLALPAMIAYLLGGIYWRRENRK